MKIAINTLPFDKDKMGGRVYITNLIHHLAKIDDKNDYYLFLSPLNEVIFQEVGRNFQKIIIPLYSYNRILRILYEQLIIPYYVQKYKIDILFSPGNQATLFPKCVQVLTIHGLLTIRPLRHRYATDEVSMIKAAYYRFMLPWSIKRANQVIVVSHDTKKWLLKQVRIPSSKVKVIYEGVDFDKFFGATSHIRLPNFNKPYILFVSTLFKYKNADKLIRAFAQLKRESKIVHMLVIVGIDLRKQLRFLKQLAYNLGVKDDICFVGQISYDQIADVYKHADSFVYPSTLETFGLPVLEAMACGVPVIGSNRCSIPEIIGDAGLIVDPENINELAEAILKLILDKHLRKDLIEKGLKRVKEFTWEKTAKKTLKVFEEVYKEKHV